MLSTSEILETRAVKLSHLIEELNGQMQVVPAEMAQLPLAERAAIVIQLSEIKSILKGGVTCINKISSYADENLCRKIVDETDDVTYRTDSHTLTASARGFFGVVDAEVFLATLGGDIQKFCELVGSKTALNKWVEQALSNAEPLPLGIKEHIVPKITVRKKNDR